MADEQALERSLLLFKVIVLCTALVDYIRLLHHLLNLFVAFGIGLNGPCEVLDGDGFILSFVFACLDTRVVAAGI